MGLLVQPVEIWQTPFEWLFRLVDGRVVVRISLHAKSGVIFEATHYTIELVTYYRRIRPFIGEIQVLESLLL